MEMNPWGYLRESVLLNQQLTTGFCLQSKILNLNADLDIYYNLHNINTFKQEGIMSRFSLIGLAVVLVLSLNAVTVSAADESIGSVKSFNGTVRLMSGNDITDITKVGQEIKSTDRIQTEDGTVEIKFKDGAVLKVDPFSVIGVTERTEEKGIFFKSKEDARRLTANTGTAFFKSGKDSTKKNYLQTPTAVCGLRGTAGSWGNDCIKLIEGSYKKNGNISDREPTRNTAQNAFKNAVFQALQQAAAAKKRAGDTPNATVKKSILKVKQLVSQELLKNPDPVVRQMSKAENAIAKSMIKVIEVQERVAEAQKNLAEAMNQGKDDSSINDAKEAFEKAQRALTQLEQSLEKAVDSFESGDDKGAFNAALDAEQKADQINATVTQTYNAATTRPATQMPTLERTVTDDDTGLPVGTTYVAQ